MSIDLWGVTREFPTLPLFTVFDESTAIFNKIVLSIFIVSLVSVMLFDTKAPLLILFTSLLYLLIEDQMRWQPWVYIYILILLPFLFNIDKRQKLVFLRILFIGIYIWSGIHKINPYFNDLIVESFAVDFFKIKNLEVISILKSNGAVIPIFEITCGLLLLFTTTRKLAVLGILSMHIFIFIYLSPLVMMGNYIVLPWNIFMILAVYLLFYNESEKIIFSYNIYKKAKIFYSILIFVLCIPSLNHIKLWDTYASFSLYSGNASNFYILSQKSIPKLTKYEILNEQLLEGKIIDIGKWSSDQLNVPIPPERRLFNQIIAKLNKTQLKLSFLETNSPLWKRKILDTYSLKTEKEEKTWIKNLAPIVFKDSVTLGKIKKF